MSELARRLAELSPAQRALLERRLGSKTSHAPPSIPALPRDTRGFPLSPAQERMWFNHQWDPDVPVYTETVALAVEGPLDADVLEASYRVVVGRHESLRTTFAIRDGQLRQEIEPTGSVAFERVNLTALPPQSRATTAWAAVRALARQPFQLDRPPLARLHCFRLSEHEHVIAFAAHHIVFDGWSAGILFRELFASYAVLAAGQPVQLPPLPVQYVDYAAWQRDLSRTHQYDAQLAYWRQQLAGAPAELRLPADRPRPPVRQSEGAVVTFGIPASLTARLDALSRAHRATLSMTLLAAFAALLARYGGQDAVVIGMPSTNRDRDDLAGVIGLFVNTLLIRARVDGDAPFVELLEQVRDTSVAAYANRDVPFEHVVEALRPERDVRRAALFQVMFDYQKLLRHPLPPGITTELREVDNGTAKFDIGLAIRDVADGLRGRLEYATALFDASTAERLAAHYQRLLAAIVEAPHTPVGRLPLLSPAERSALTAGQQARVPESPETTLPGLFEAQVRRQPDALAVRDGATALTFAELDARASRLARRLRREGAGRGDVVGVWADGSVAAITGILAIWRAGAAYLPLDPAYPRARLEHMLRDAAVRVVVGTAAPSGLPSAVRWLSAEAPDLATDPAEPPAVTLSGRDLAYVIYTSGSTGQPKGVMVEHRAVVNLLGALRETVYQGGAPAPLRVAVLGSLAFDTSVKQLVQLLDGHQLELVPPALRFEPVELLAWIRRTRVDVLDGTPSLIAGLVEAGLLQAGEHLPGRLLLGGEAVPARLWDTLAAADGIACFNLYGPTECTVDATAARLVSSAAGPSLGRPLPNVAVYVLDRNLEPVPIGAPGEIYVGGAGVGRGYLGRPAQTAERFLPDPYAAAAGARMYRTGDLGRWRGDGTLEFLRRADAQVKVRGYRVELEEIEAELRQHPGVRDAAVVLRQDAAGHGRLAAYVVPDPRRAPTINGHVRYRLPNNLAVVDLNRNETDFLYEDIFVNRAYARHGVGIGPGDCVFDVGANVGLFALYAHASAPDVRVYAFEPNPAACAALRENLSLYDVAATVLPVALSDHRGQREYTHYARFSSLSGLYADPADDQAVVRSFVRRRAAGQAATLAAADSPLFDELLAERFQSETFPVELCTLSDVIAEHGIQRIDLLKINVEKSELDVLLGIAPDDWAKIQQAVLEVHDIDGRVARVTDLLERQGFIVAVEQDWQLEAETRTNYYVYARRPGRPPRDAAPPDLAFPEPFVTPAALQEQLRTRLPDYMVPAEIALLDALPLTAHGKVDRAALLAVTAPPASERPYRAAESPAERTLAELWADVLQVPRVGVEDDYFALGGDSIASIQIVARARQAGLQLTTRDLFQHRTIAALCQHLAPEAPTAALLPAVDGPVALTPIQRVFAAAAETGALGDPNHFNQWVLLELPDWSDAVVQQAVAVLAERHDALRLRFEHRAGDWRQRAAPGEPAAPLAVHDLGDVSQEAHAAAVERIAAALHTSLDLEHGPIWRVALIRAAGRRPHLLWVAHHLVVDAVTWRILAAELAQTGGQLAGTAPAVELPAVPTSYLQWAARLEAYAASDAALTERDYWASQAAPAAAPWLVDAAGPARTASTRLDEERTTALLQRAGQAYHLTVEEVLLAALVRALDRDGAGAPRALAIESHGRDHPLSGIDVASTAGWFTTVFPLRLAVRGTASPAELLLAVKEQLRAVPWRGFNYGVLRWLRPDTAASLGALPEPPVLFNYLGTLGTTLAGAEDSAVRLVGGGLSVDPAYRPRHAVEANALVADGRLELRVTAAETVATALAAAWQEAVAALVAHCTAPGVGGYSPSDFPRARLSARQLERAMAELAGGEEA